MTGVSRRAAAALAGVLVVAALAVVVIVTRHSSEGGSSARAAAPPLSGTQAQATARSVQCPSDRRPTASRAALRAFPAAAAVICRYDEGHYADGDWSVQVKQVSHHSLARFVAALDRPDGTNTGQACAAYAEIEPALVLVDATGHTLTPRFPRDGCGHLQVAAKLQLSRLAFTTVSVRKLHLDRSQASIVARCEPQWKNENAMYAEAGGQRLRAAGPVLVPGRLRMCRYRVGNDPDGGNFVRGTTLDTATSTRLRAALGGAGVAGTCPVQRSFAVVFGSNGASVNVELGGCYRVSAEGGAGRADGSVLTAVLG